MHQVYHQHGKEVEVEAEENFREGVLLHAVSILGEDGIEFNLLM